MAAGKGTKVPAGPVFGLGMAAGLRLSVYS
jgi:hypothetical protein